MNGVHGERGPRRGAPPAGSRLSRAAVVERAAALLARDGPDHFSLRGLAVELGVRPSALYNHVHSHDDLLTAVVDHEISRFPMPQHDDRRWEDWLRELGGELRRWLLDRPGLAGPVLGRAGSTEAGQALLARVVDELADDGLDPAIGHLAWHLVFSLVVGAVQQDLARGAATDGTFEEILDITLTGLTTTATLPASPAARRLLTEHGFDRSAPSV